MAPSHRGHCFAALHKVKFSTSYGLLLSWAHVPALWNRACLGGIETRFTAMEQTLHHSVTYWRRELLANDSDIVNGTAGVMEMDPIANVSDVWNNATGISEKPDNVDSVFVLTGIGLILGVVHVITGPDHVTALMSLAVGTSWKSFYLGVRWGFGHSTGLLIMALVFLAAKGHLDFKKLTWLDGIVGVMMIALGAYGIVTS
eukprot:9312163-Pyramimonas_sp.AAC.1